MMVYMTTTDVVREVLIFISSFFFPYLLSAARMVTMRWDKTQPYPSWGTWDWIPCLMMMEHENFLTGNVGLEYLH